MKPALSLINTFFEEKERWFLWLPIFMLSGIYLYSSIKWEPSILWVGLSLLLSLLTYHLRRWPNLVPLSSIFLMIMLGFNAAQLETWRLHTPLLTEPIKEASITGTLIRAEALPTGSRLTLKNPWIKNVSKEDRPHLVRIKTRVKYKDLPEAGTRINVWGPLWPPSDPVTPHGYNFRKHAYFAQIGGSGVSYVPPRIRTAKHTPPFFWDGFMIRFEKARRYLTLMTYQYLDSPIKEMTATLLSGSQSGIDRDIMKDMRLSGLTHLLSISGIHVSMMALLIYVPLRFLLALWPWAALRFPIKKIAAFAAISATSLYTILVGADAPTVRSALMTGIVFFAIISDRKALSLRLVALAAMAIMLITPSASLGPSFQMSFAAVLAMIAAYEKSIHQQIKEGASFKVPHWISATVKSICAIALTSVIATAATAPFTIYHFQSFSFYGVLANMIAIPLTSIWVMPCLLLTYIFAPFNLAAPFIIGAGWGVQFIIDLAHFVAAWPLSQISFPPMPPWIFALMGFSGLWLCLWKKKWRFAGLAPLLLCFAYPLFYPAPSVYIGSESPIIGVMLKDERFVVLGKRKENFTTAQWRQQIGWPETLYLPKYVKEKIAKDLTCTPVHCLYTKENTRIAFLAPPDKKVQKQVPPTCPKATIIVGAWDLSHCKNETNTIIDRYALLKRGAHSITFKNNTPQIHYVRKEDVNRPWSIR